MLEPPMKLVHTLLYEFSSRLQLCARLCRANTRSSESLENITLYSLPIGCTPIIGEKKKRSNTSCISIYDNFFIVKTKFNPKWHKYKNAFYDLNNIFEHIGQSFLEY